MKSILVIKNSIILIFVDILAPPTNAATGLTGNLRTDVKALISWSSKIPEKDGKKFVYIDVSLCNVHLLRSPIDANLQVKDHIKGLNLPSFKYKAKKLNERMTLDFGKLKVNLLSGFFNGSMKFKDITSLSKGERIGILLNGLVVIELSNDEKLFVKIGDKVKAGETILGAFKE